jgi:hypothetical protein
MRAASLSACGIATGVDARYALLGNVLMFLRVLSAAEGSINIDMLFTSHRGHGHTLAKGSDVQATFAEIAAAVRTVLK